MNVEELKEYDSYEECKADLAYVSKGGRGYASCSFMDISVRIDRLKSAKDKLIYAIGEGVLAEMEELNLK